MAIKHVDAAIVGAGFTGLSAALHLRRAGVEVAVLEAVEPGWGASGRNNGQVIPTLSRAEPDDIVARHGAAGERFVALLRDSASILFDLVREEGLEAEAEQTGWIQPVHSPGRMKIAERRVAAWSKLGAPVELLSREEVGAGSARMPGSAAGGTGPAATSTRWRWCARSAVPSWRAAARSTRARRRSPTSARATAGS